MVLHSKVVCLLRCHLHQSQIFSGKPGAYQSVAQIRNTTPRALLAYKFKIKAEVLRPREYSSYSNFLSVYGKCMRCCCNQLLPSVRKILFYLYNLNVTL